MPANKDIGALQRALIDAPVPVSRGCVRTTLGSIVKAELPGSLPGSLVLVEGKGEKRVAAEVISRDGVLADLALLAGDIFTPSPRDSVRVVQLAPQVPCGWGLLGRAVDPLGVPVDGGLGIVDVLPWPLNRAAPEPLSRLPITDQMVTGVRALDGCLALGVGQRVGLFAGPGLGKSSLIGTLVERAMSEVIVVCLVGERGREAGEFLRRFLESSSRNRSVVVVSTADAPPQNRVRALDTATAVAEWFRLQGRNVLLLVDSLTRVVRARREVAFALGEQPVRGGFPASAFASLPGLLERTGRAATGSITAIYTVLIEGDDDPLAEEARSLLDGHIVLSEKLARLGHWPAIDILSSVSRTMESVVSDDVARAAARLRRLVAAYREHEDLILMGAYRRGTCRDTDEALSRKVAIDTFLRQAQDETSSLSQTHKALMAFAKNGE